MSEDKFVIAKIVIERIVTGEGGDSIWVKAEDEAGEPLALVIALGMLRMTEDSLIRMDMGEVPEEYLGDEEEEDESDEDEEDETDERL